MNSTEIYNYSGSLVNLDYTISYSKVSCIREFYFVHVTFCYLVFLSGIACFITRIYQPLKWLHVWFGRIYIITMLLNTASSLIIHNTGLPAPTLVAFAFTLCGMCLGWILIKFYQIQIRNIVTNMVEEAIKQMNTMNAIDNKTFNLKKLYNNKLIQYINNRTWKQRYFSLKTVHGVLMTLSIFGIVGRIFASDQSGDFTCNTYPVYKPVNTNMGATKGMDLENKPLQLVPETDPDYDRLPWAGVESQFAVQGFFTPVLIAAVVGLIWACVAARRMGNKDNTYSSLKRTDSNKDVSTVDMNEQYGATELQATNIEGDE